MTQQSRVEFWGGPKDGEIIYSAPEYLGKLWMKPVLNVRLPSEPAEYYVYKLEPIGPHMLKYKYDGVLAKEE